MKKIIKCAKASEITYEQWMEAMQNSEGFKQVAALCSKYGYKLFELNWSGKLLECNIRPVEEYCPDIYLRRDRKSKSSYFVAQTTAYGALTSEEYSKFRNAVEQAYALLTALNDIDFLSMDIIHYDYDEE